MSAGIPHIPILRCGIGYDSVERVTLRHHATGEPIAEVSQANSGMIARDVRRMRDDVLEGMTVAQLLQCSRIAADVFLTARLPLGEGDQSFDEYIRQLSGSTGMPVSYCRSNAQKIRTVLYDMGDVIRGLTRGFDLAILDRGFGPHGGGMLSFFREGRVFGAVLPSNSPGVHSLWAPAISLKAPIVLKPGRDEPWTPLRMIAAFRAAGVPSEAMSFYPTDHGGAAELLRVVDRSMLFGDAGTTSAWRRDPRVEVHGPGFSKVILGEDAANDWEKYIDVIVASITANGGRSCINASAVWTPRNSRPLAEAIAAKLAAVQALPADDPQASLAAFSDASTAERITAAIDRALVEPVAVDCTQRLRGAPRLARIGRCAYLLPTVIWCDSPQHPLANREFLFPFASVVECPIVDIPQAIGRSLVVTAITNDAEFLAALMRSSNVERLNIGAIPTFRISWDQPHEGNLFTHLYRQRAFQIEPAA